MKRISIGETNYVIQWIEILSSEYRYQLFELLGPGVKQNIRQSALPDQGQSKYQKKNTHKRTGKVTSNMKAGA